MKRFLAAAVAVLALAAPRASRADVKIGYVNLQEAVTTVDEGKAAREQLKKEFEAKQKMLDDKQNELKRMKDDLDKQMIVMSEDTKREKAMEFEKKVMDMQQVYQQMQKDLQDKERDMMKVIFDKMESIIKEIAASEKYEFVFEQQNAGLIVAPPAGNMTAEVIRRYNAKYKAGAPKKADPKPAPKK